MNHNIPKKLYKLSAFLIITFSSQMVGYGQQSINVSIFNEATTIPFTTLVNTPLHPGLQIASDFHWKESKRFALYPTISIGYMLHQKLFQGVYANVELGFDYKSPLGINLKSKIGVGYLHTFSTRQEYQFRDGRYESKRDKGNPRIMPSLTVGLGYNLKRNDPYSPEVFILYQSWIEYPYSPGFIPLMAHTNLHIGTKLRVNKNDK